MKFSHLNQSVDKVALLYVSKYDLSEEVNDSDNWKGGTCQRHEEEMLNLLRDACGMSARDGERCE